MQIGNRHFPYPILNHNSIYSDYNPTSDFFFQFTKSESNGLIIERGEVNLKNLCFQIANPELEVLIDEGKLGCCLMVECSASVFREKYEISRTPTDVYIPATNFNDRVEFSCYLYAKEAITDFKSGDFDPFYEEYSFDMEKYDILAVDDGFRVKIEIDPSQDDKVSSIFTITTLQADDLVAKTIYDTSGITIALPQVARTAYETMKMQSQYNNIAFAMIAIPALTYCLMDIQATDFNSIEDIIDTYSWFKSVKKSYYAKTGSELTFESFDSFKPFELAQIVLNEATCNGVIDFSKGSRIKTWVWGHRTIITLFVSHGALIIYTHLANTFYSINLKPSWVRTIIVRKIVGPRL